MGVDTDIPWLIAWFKIHKAQEEIWYTECEEDGMSAQCLLSRRWKQQVKFLQHTDNTAVIISDSWTACGHDAKETD